MVDGSTKERSGPQRNSFVLLKDMTKHRAKWKVGKIVDAIVGRNESHEVTRSRHITVMHFNRFVISRLVAKIVYGRTMSVTNAKNEFEKSRVNGKKHSKGEQERRRLVTLP